MKNKVSDVRNHLVAMLEALGEDNVPAEEMTQRIARAKATSEVAGQYVATVRVELDAIKVMDETNLLPGSVDQPQQVTVQGPALRAINGGR